MKLKQLLTDDRAVSPVIGVILMVAITVILAAVIGTFVLGLGDSVNSAPQASLGFNFTAAGTGDAFNGHPRDIVTITHESGETLSKSTLTVQGSNSSTQLADKTNPDWPDQIQVGDSDAYKNVDPGETIRVIWSAEGSNSQQTIARAQSPT